MEVSELRQSVYVRSAYYWKLARFIQDIFLVKALISGMGKQNGHPPILLTLICPRADSTEPAGFSMCGSIANVCMWCFLMTGLHIDTDPSPEHIEQVRRKQCCQ